MMFLLRPRFLPDKDSAREWGVHGAWLARLIRKGFAVPPTAAMGLSEVHAWLSELPEYSPAMLAWSCQDGGQGGAQDGELVARLSELREAILRTPMPEHWKLSTGTLRRFLCGDTEEEIQPWPMILRPSMSANVPGLFESVVVELTSPDAIWRGFLQVAASAFTLESARRLKYSGVDPARFRVGVLIQPRLVAEAEGVGESAGVQDRFRADLRKRTLKAERLVGKPVQLEWLWDGEQLWYLGLRALPSALGEAADVQLSAPVPKKLWDLMKDAVRVRSLS